jgi:ribosomal protein S3
LNKRKLRIKKHPDVPTFLGYKFQLRGRFSRKQRAHNMVFRKGLVPLNTMSIKMDFAFASAVLFNSLVSIKVWLYKTPHHEKSMSVIW